MKGERMAKRSSFGSIMRRRLSDITNSQSRPKVLLSHEEKPSQVSPASGDLVDQLIKVKLLSGYFYFILFYFFVTWVT